MPLSASANLVNVSGLSFSDLLKEKQEITHLRITAGIDTCHIRFRTRQPTIPFVAAVAPDGTTVGASFPLFGGLRTRHEMLLGQGEPLPQATEIKLKIVAAGHTFLGEPHEVVIDTSFKTGARHAKIDFTEIKVHIDGDPGIRGAGDFRWFLGAGNADNGERLDFRHFERDADAGELLPIRQQINLPFAPRRLGIAASGTDDDADILFAPGLPIVGFPGIAAPGTGEVNAAEMNHAWVTEVFDIAEAANGAVIPMTLATGTFAVAFTVKGRITVTTTPGRSPVLISISDWLKPTRPFAGIGGRI